MPEAFGIALIGKMPCDIYNVYGTFTPAIIAAQNLRLISMSA